MLNDSFKWKNYNVKFKNTIKVLFVPDTGKNCIIYNKINKKENVVLRRLS